MKTNNQMLMEYPTTRRDGFLTCTGWRVSRRLTAVTACVLLLGTHLTQAANFADGGTHTISDATYQNEGISVSNNTTLIIEPGAVFGGAGTSSGNVSVFDSSTVTINGGTFGDAGIFSGNVSVFDSSTLTINGGIFGGAGTASGQVHASGSSTVTIDGGTFGGAGTSSGQVHAIGSPTVAINGGSFEKHDLSFYFSGATVTFRASNYDTTEFVPDRPASTILGVTFCSQSPQWIEMYFDVATAETVTLETVTCENPLGRINDLIIKVTALPIKTAIKNALVVKLNAAVKALSAGDTATACAGLLDFVDLTMSQSGKKLLPVTDADVLIADALAILTALGCP